MASKEHARCKLASLWARDYTDVVRRRQTSVL